MGIRDKNLITLHVKTTITQEIIIRNLFRITRGRQETSFKEKQKEKAVQSKNLSMEVIDIFTYFIVAINIFIKKTRNLVED